jgi:hypothetical protein
MKMKDFYIFCLKKYCLLISGDVDICRILDKFVQFNKRDCTLKSKFIFIAAIFLMTLQLLGQEPDPDKAQTLFPDIPASHIYQNFWDHINIGYYRLDDSLVPDSLVIEILPVASSSFVFPTPTSNKVISRFGKRGSRQHWGTDIKIAGNDTILAAFDGKVRLSRTYHGYGYMVAIRHFNGLETFYGHLSKILVKENEWVQAGTPIGLGGRTGRASTTHLHFETRILGVPINPEDYINFETGELKANVLYFDKRRRKLRSEMYEREQFDYPMPLLPSISNIRVFTR